MGAGRSAPRPLWPTPCYLFAARAKDATPLAGFAAAHFEAPADVVDDGDIQLVTLRAGSIRFAHRLAGLDRDPGWVPWLERHVRLRFVHPEDERDGPAPGRPSGEDYLHSCPEVR